MGSLDVCPGESSTQTLFLRVMDAFDDDFNTSTLQHLETLVGESSSLVMRPIGPRNILSVRMHPWPSWLTRGSPKVVDFFLYFFYLSDVTDFERAPGTCPHC